MTYPSTPVDKPVLRIGCDALPEIEHTRFAALFQVAQTRSAVNWQLVPPAQAQVVVSHGLPWRATRAVSLCIDPSASCLGDADVVPLDSGFRVASLIQALDEAAARVSQSAAWLAASDAVAYRLHHWVVLGADKQSARHARVMAAMSRRAVTRDWMLTGGSLSSAEVDAMLAELRAHGALRESKAELSSASGKPSTAAGSRALSSRPGLVGRLRHWFSSARAGMVQ